MPPVGFEPAVPASEKSKTRALDRAVTGIGLHFIKRFYVSGSLEVRNVLPIRLSKTNTPNSVGGTGFGSDLKNRVLWSKCSIIWGFFENLSRKFKFHYNQTNKKVFYVKTSLHFWSYLAHFFLERKNVPDKHYRENQNTHFYVQ
jgi:hypothetical protein